MTISYVSVGDDRVSILGYGAFLQLEERLKDFVLVMEIVVHDVDEQGLVHDVSNELA
jgi:hypothetical protein